MLFNLTPELLVANLIALGLGMTVHEFAHNYVGWRMGDPVPAREGRLTLNPLVHINWIGWIMFALLGFGILGSAPISPYRMRNPRWGFLAAVGAGPMSNLLLAILFAIPMRLMFEPIELIMAYQQGGVENFLPILLLQIIQLNVLLFVFNLLPLFPIDGWHIVFCLLPPDLASTWQRHAQTTQYIFFGLILLSFVRLPGIPNILSLLIGGPSSSLTGFLIGL